MSRISLEGQVAIVTGAARGLGRTYALDLAAHGAAVVVNDLPGGGAGTVVDEIGSAGGRAIAVERDIVDPEGARAVVEAATGLGRLGILVNNAGMLRNGRFEELTAEKIRDILAVHLAGAFFVTQPAFAAMRDVGYGRIVNVSSNTSFGMAGLVNYAAAKAGVLGLTTSLAQEGAPHGIAVNSVLPNGTSTIMDDDPIPGFEDDTRFVAAFQGVAHRFEPERTAALVTFLASPACPASGEHFSSLGGRFARVLYAVTEGWMSPAGAPAGADDVAEHFAEIADAGRIALLPTSIRDEFELVARSLASDTRA
ncbi:SDR family NAD(P)-dependent oxidoreductase [Baekduia soli]|uniref:SDR family NAD(P)-dependent oxidoreductase n=1 Tax=Baekduia soli TaxID=496014 RepID=A0A5B8UD01_9ACTN|nr:SDR family NAD(P)-dependent oxidoreductase [Baekduia soli]QEC50561.1 SDR family NAD(P)-dependent oxidoreductase [Baekduia soli]